MGLATWLGFTDPGQSAELTAARLPENFEQTPTGMWPGALSLAGLSPNPATQTPITRWDALKVPALNNGIKLLCGITQQLPLAASDGASADTVNFLKTLDPQLPVGWTLARTVDALAFYGLAWWTITSRYQSGFPATVEYVDPTLVNVTKDSDGQPLVTIEGERWPSKDLIRFSGVSEGILYTGSEAIRTALANLRAVRAYATNPAPHMYVTDADGAEPLDETEARKYLVALRDAVATNGSAYLAGLKINEVGWSARELQLVEARQVDAVEMARLLAIPPSYVAAPTSSSSITYTTLPEVRRDLVEVGGLSLYAVPIQQRLSMPDVTPRGTTVRFDSDSFFLQVNPQQADPSAQQDAANRAATNPTAGNPA